MNLSRNNLELILSSLAGQLSEATTQAEFDVFSRRVEIFLTSSYPQLTAALGELGITGEMFAGIAAGYVADSKKAAKLTEDYFELIEKAKQTDIGEGERLRLYQSAIRTLTSISVLSKYLVAES